MKRAGHLKEEPPFKCEQCGTQFCQISSRNRHIREQHLKPGAYKCKQCGIRFSKKYNLQMHEKHAHSKDIKKGAMFKCSYCSCIFNGISVLKKHTTNYHKKSQSLQNSQSSQEVLNDSMMINDDAQTIAENVLQELIQLQKDIMSTSLEQSKTQENLKTLPNTSDEIFAIDSAIVENITIKDKLYPLGHFTQHKVQIIKRTDGFTYYICEYCSKEFKKLFDYLRHRRIHTKIRPFKCVLCKKSFPTTTQLKTHCLTHKLYDKFGISKRFIKCPKCKEGFTSIRQLDKHLGSHLNYNISFECPECLKSFKSLKSVIHHKHSRKDPELDLLKSLLPLPFSLVEEENTKIDDLKEKENAFLCSLCGLQLSSKLILKHHEERHKQLFKYQCNICNSGYVSKSSLNLHKKQHQNPKIFICQECNKSFYNSYQLQRHQLTHSKINYKCQYCDKTFKTTQNCRYHMMTHLKQLIKTNEENMQNTETLIYKTKIQYCNQKEVFNTTTQIVRSKKKSTRKRDLDNGRDDLKYKCLKCNKSFRYAAWLKKHFNYKHTNERPYECKNCLKKFRTKQILETHLLLHADFKPKITCQVCGKHYASDKSLKIHLRIHTQEKRFTCGNCKKQFRTSGHLIQHQKSNHKDINKN